MIKLVSVSALTVSAALAFSGAASAFGNSDQNMRPPESFQGQWYTAPAGCSYSRAQASGEQVKWNIIMNPHHIGKSNAKKSCPAQL